MRRAMLLVAAIALFFVFGCPSQPQQPLVEEPAAPVVQPPPAPEAAPCSIGNVVQRDDCFLARALEKKDNGICRNIYSVDRLDQCYAIFAATDLEACKMVRNAEMKNSCLSENAVRQKSEAICNLIDNAAARADCLKKVVPACQLVLDPTGRQLCMALEENDYTLCQTDPCFVQYAQNKSEEAPCGLVKAEIDRYYCLAVVRNSAAVCQQASQAALQDACMEKVAKKLNDVYVCDLATKGSSYANSCYLYFAVKDGKMDICKKPYTEELRDSCYSDWATQSANTSSCINVINTVNRNGCYFTAARTNRLPSLCNPIINDANRNSCFSQAITGEKGPIPRDCEAVSGQEWRDKCYRISAQKTYDQSYCGKISPDSYEKDTCDSLFQ